MQQKLFHPEISSTWKQAAKRAPRMAGSLGGRSASPRKSLAKLVLGYAMCIVFSLGVVAANPVFAYEPNSTHSALTDEIIDFYNLFYEPNISEEEKEWVVTGAIEEDIPPRYNNHFYDPVYNRGWKGVAYTSKDWAQNIKNPSLGIVVKDTFARIIFRGSSIETIENNDYNWQRGIEAYVEGDKQLSFEVLGHILHLIEDTTVPAHT